MALPQGVHLTIPAPRGGESILTTEALDFLAILHRTFDKRRKELLEARNVVQAALDKVSSRLLPIVRRGVSAPAQILFAFGSPPFGQPLLTHVNDDRANL